MVISSSALLPRVGSLKINIRWKPASGALENLKVADTHSATHFTPLCSLLPMPLNSQVPFLALALQGSPHFHFCLHCFTVCVPFFPREQKGEVGKVLTKPPPFQSELCTAL